MKKYEKLDLQLFSEDPSNPSEESEVKTFTQEQVDKIVSERLSKQSKSIYKKFGCNSDEDVQSLLERISKHDEVLKENETLKGENAVFKKQELDRTYKTQLKSVDDDYVDIVFSQLPPNKDEKVEDYGARVSEYLTSHPKLAKSQSSVVGSFSSNPNLKGEQLDASQIALRKAMGLAIK